MQTHAPTHAHDKPVSRIRRVLEFHTGRRDRLTSKTSYYSSTSRDILTKASAYLEQDDLLQASEKGWGRRRADGEAHRRIEGWRHEGHRELYQVVGRLSEENGDPEMRTLFRLAGDLHINFYEGWLTREMVEDGLAQVAELTQRLDRLA